MNDLRGAKAQENGHIRQRGRESAFVAGPFLAKEGAKIVIPSPCPHPKFTAVLRTYGFHFEPGLFPAWARPTNKPHLDKSYSPDGWLDWARQHYAKAWPLWAGVKETNDGQNSTSA